MNEYLVEMRCRLHNVVQLICISTTKHCQHKMGTIHAHACYKGKPMIIIWLNALFQMNCRLQMIRNKKKPWKQENLIVCTRYKGKSWTMHTFSTLKTTKKNWIFRRMLLNIVEIRWKISAYKKHAIKEFLFI